MARRFNVGGPCRPDLHYMLPPLRRLPTVRSLIEGQQYFVLHAPRQTGKTTAIEALARQLTDEGAVCALRVSVERARVFESIEEAEPVVLEAWADAALASLPDALQPPPWPAASPGNRVGRGLLTWARSADRPLVLFIDEIDALAPPVLGSLLSQLRDGFSRRPGAFPASLGLVGMRDVREYLVASGGQGRRGAGSPFNVTSGSLLLRDFDRDEIGELYQQHTDDTGQCFTEAAIERAWTLTRGQPWLVNALAREAVEVLVADGAPVDASVIDAARERLIQRRDTHLDSLVERLREPRVRKVIEPIMAGGVIDEATDDDVRYVVELGLARRDAHGALAIANPLYAEVIPRALADAATLSMPSFEPVWLTPQGALDEAALLDAFVDFWRRHGEPLMGTAPYHEIAPHLVTMAFLHRVANGGGSIEREYAIGSGRLDLCLRHRGAVLPIELKVWKPGRPDPRDDGLRQLDRYLAGLGADRGWLIIFDRRPEAPPLADRTVVEGAQTPGGRAVVVIRA